MEALVSELVVSLVSESGDVVRNLNPTADPDGGKIPPAGSSRVFAYSLPPVAHARKQSRAKTDVSWIWIWIGS